MASHTLVSGIRATGELHIGNYYGALKGISLLQHQFDCYFFIADLHALTTHPNPKQLSNGVIGVARDYLAAGLDPERSIFFAQSSIAAELGELHTYLSMVMPLGELLRCPTFKEKAKKHPDNVNYGLVGYPVLMTADILAHRGTIVQVGEDQLVHLEMARSIVRRFNQQYGAFLPEPQPLPDNAVKVPSLTGQGKMSKSDPVETYISLKDEPERIQAKLKKAYSDPLRVYRDQPGHPTADGCNVYQLHTFFTEEDVRRAMADRCLKAEIGCVACKAKLAESIEQLVEPFRQQRERLSDREVMHILAAGGQKARESAQRVISEVRAAMGLLMV
ncbi:tryptophan--tRNA ligase [Paenibacillus koleovorans]|uniref:tryptophan--tRNA ligase n=1 Tax=Paenibacillus koleovorans TaxID=121608 RepID=UPI000FD82BE0|nr:tryptophan--tRNA ligase [Paenibacillus koleovorans]